MSFTQLAPYLFFAFAAAWVGSGIGLQSLRERLVQNLIAQHSPLALEVSDWAMKGAIPGGDGYWNGIKTEYLWGEKANTFLANPTTRPLIVWARVLRLVRNVTWFGFIATGVLYLALLRLA